MKRPVLPVLLAIGMALAGCTTVTDPGPEPVDRLLVIDGAGAATMGPDGTDRIDLDPGDGARFFQGAWSSDAARLAVSGQGPEGPFIDFSSALDPTAARIETATLPFYLSWEPGGNRVAYLANGLAGIDLRLVTDAPDGPTEDLLDTGQPYYFDWHPTGERMVIHVGGSRLGILEPGIGTETVRTDPAPFQTPQWSPDGARILHATSGDRLRIVLSAATDSAEEVVAAYEGFAYFAIDPSGSRVAVATLAGESGPVITASTTRSVADHDTLVIVDLAGGDAMPVGDEPTVGFWWNPRGDALLFLTVDAPVGDGLMLQWHVWQAGVVTDLERFTPSGTFARDLLPFFDQYARSMTLWSPDGTRFAYAGAPEGDPTGVWVHDLVAGSRERVADGVFVAWSPR